MAWFVDFPRPDLPPLRVTCGSSAELRDAIKAYYELPPNTAAPVTFAVSGEPTVHAQGEPSDLTSILAMLVALRDAGDRGVLGEVLAARCGLSDARGLGGLLAHLNRRLAPLGILTSEVLKSLRTPDGRAWIQGPRLEEAFRHLNQDRLMGRVMLDWTGKWPKESAGKGSRLYDLAVSRDKPKGRGR